MSGRWNELASGDNSSQDFTQATQEESGLELDEYTQVEPVQDASAEDGTDSGKEAEPVPWGRLMKLSGGSAIPLMPRAEQPQGRALNEVMLGRGKVCEVQVADQRISSKHCRIYCEVVAGHLGGMEVYVEDMSANGTWINQDTKLARGQRRLLHSGDEISLLNPYKHHKRAAAGASSGERDRDRDIGGGDPGKDSEDPEKLEAEAATYTFINLNRNRGASNGRAGMLSVAETLQAATPEGVTSPALRSSASGVAGVFGGARKVEDLYDVREMIGHGTSGEVRRAINRLTGKQFAVKVIETRKFALTPGLTPKELVQEAEMLKRVDHEYIIKLEDIFQTDQAVYLVMDLVNGGDLFDRIVEKGVYAEDLAQELLFRVLTAVDYLHSQDIVHRDLKPENILLVGRDDDVDVKITDFGLAKRANKEGLKTFCGTPQYFAPEVLKRRNTVLGVGRYGKEADMWSVGVILYILLSGTHPFHTTTLFDQITHASYSMDGAEWTRISDAAKDLVTKLLTESPKDRLTAAQALAHPFIVRRAGAKRAGAAATARLPASGALSADPSKEPATDSGEGQDPEAQTTAGVEAASATSHGGAGIVDNGTPSADGDHPAGTAGAAGQSSQGTDVSSNSGAEDASLKSLSPTEGGGGSAAGAPAWTKDSPRMSPRRAPPQIVAPDLPPPHPREPAKPEAGGGRGGGRVRKRPKRDGPGEKPPPPYSQLRMHVVGVTGAPDSEAASGSNQEEPVRAGATASDRRDNRNALHSIAAPASASACTPGPGGATDVAEPRSAEQSDDPGCANGPANSQAKGSESDTPSTPEAVVGRRRGGGKHKVSAAGPSAQFVSEIALSEKQASCRSVEAAAGATASPALADDEIIDYSSEDSPAAKSKRTRVGRSRASMPAPSPRTAAAASRKKAIDGDAKPNVAKTDAVAMAPADGARRGAARGTKSNGASRGAHANDRHQMHLKLGDSGKLDLAKLRSLSRVGAGSRKKAGAEQGNGDRAAQAAAGGSAATFEDSLGGGAPAGAGGRGKDAGDAATGEGRSSKSGKKAKEKGRPQRTMTHLWGRAGDGAV